MLPQARLGVAKSASGVSEKPKELSKSSVSSKCLTTEETLQGQIVQLKEKAHQSFMQVMYPSIHAARCSNSTRKNSNCSETSSPSVRHDFTRDNASYKPASTLFRSTLFNAVPQCSILITVTAGEAARVLKRHSRTQLQAPQLRFRTGRIGNR